jgi:hypothetical protein
LTAKKQYDFVEKLSGGEETFVLMYGFDSESKLFDSSG